MFLMCTAKNGKQIAMARDRIVFIEEAPDEERAKDVRTVSVVTVALGGQHARVPVQDKLFHLMQNFHGN